jgi:hypothetical protein
MAANFMAASRMSVLRIFIENESLTNCQWQLVTGGEIVETGQDDIKQLLEISHEQIEVYLAPDLATILKVDLGAISDRKVNDELLLSLVEESLAEEIENCKPLLMRLTDGDAYIAILNRQFHSQLISSFSEHIKSVRYIQPFPYATKFEPGIWTVYLQAGMKFVRTTQYEYFLLDDNQPLPEVLEQMLSDYSADKIIVYGADDAVCDYFQQKFELVCEREHELIFGYPLWNFYNEKSRRFKLKLSSDVQISVKKTLTWLGIIFTIYATGWLGDLIYLSFMRARLETVVASDLNGISTVKEFSPNLLMQIDDKLTSLQHSKGVYAANDFANLFEEFLRTVPDINDSMIVGLKYSSSQLSIFLNSQFDTGRFANDRAILATKRIAADLNDYKTYQSAQTQTNQNNNGGGILDTANNTTSTTSQLADSAWVVTLQLISRMDGNEHASSTKTISK